jgi:hypothetical protein
MYAILSQVGVPSETTDKAAQIKAGIEINELVGVPTAGSIPALGTKRIIRLSS